uniref:Uncharacterized protein n=1 Tax=Candidatus Kentrum eta TaxID=2126337 RepID=A0A450VRQ3_9GAMM|nr:MAG: hypothetical protein BECKH772A_GA0070896_104173 [Candidatus Kentron sp. H]VFK07481.1 MAG: hypothetical protein BECKH772C_GA0070978_104233 [Candidatus Kentron sp. H]
MTLRAIRDALTGLRLLRREKEPGGGTRYAVHDLVREHFRRRPGWAWGATPGGSLPSTPATPPESAMLTTLHTRLYRLYAAVIQPEWRPEGIKGLRPLYEAVYHGTKAGLHQEALDDVYFNRILL